MNNIFIASDEHYGHANILKYTDRHKIWTSVDQMNEDLIDYHNSIVNKGDTVYHLGDFAFKKEIAHSIIPRLNGYHKFIRGNHDKWMDNSVFKFKNVYDKIEYYHELNDHVGMFVLLHYPISEWNKGHHGSYMLHGHCHGSHDDKNEGIRRIDCGIDSTYKWTGKYGPVTLEQIVERLKDAKIITHHGD